MKQCYLLWRKYYSLTLISLFLSLVLIIPFKIAIAIHQVPLPQAFLVLGGDPNRETYAAQLAQWYPNLDIWVSSGPNDVQTKNTFVSSNILREKLHIDNRAVDSVTNFTTLVSDFKRHKIQHLYLITSDYHMSRAKAIATLVLGSHGIAFTPLSVPSDRHTPESNLRIIRDMTRSVLWIFTGYTGAKI
ncbi:YdcF family protein [Calothrix sp. 336/3]|uniref:YdcF family protein n=1 Tax=Calothrix sp. 336/3 TaxID=1337936 RepID=UPI0004E37E61|nr:YdcF family protein [Calothrix sp. 336/3]AKG23963.1 hypothetical protein IJ00_24020 [Calothrix sp. 336/3]